jgi:hypothetical protein
MEKRSSLRDCACLPQAGSESRTGVFPWELWKTEERWRRRPMQRMRSCCCSFMSCGARRNAEDFAKVAMTPATQENAWLRQVASYWGMAASFVLQGALSEELFLRPACSGEMFVMLGKVYPFLEELREKLGDPESFLDVEKLARRSKWGRERLKFMVKRPGAWREKMEKRG